MADAIETTPGEITASSEPADSGMEMFGFIDDPMSELDEAPSESATEEGVTEGDETPSEGSDAEKPADEKPEEEKPVEIAAIPAELKEAFPEAKDIAEVTAQIATLRLAAEERDTAVRERDEEKAANTEMVDLLQSHKALIPILRDLRDGKPLYEAIRGRLEMGADEPVPDTTDVIAYNAYVKKQIALEQRLENEAKQQAEYAKKAEVAKAAAMKQKETFQKAHKLSDAEMNKRLAHISTMLYGDPVTGELPTNFLEMMERTYTYDNAIEAAKKKGEITGRNDAIDKILHKQDVRGDGIPTLRSGITREKVVVDDLSDLERSLKPKPEFFAV